MMFSKNELIYLNNCLNECLNGILLDDNDFKIRIGISKDKAKLLLDKINIEIDYFNLDNYFKKTGLNSI